MARDSIWTDAIVAKMRELAASGMTSAAIATAIGIGKNAVIGKCHREGIELLAAPPQFKQAWICDAADDLIRQRWNDKVFAFVIADLVSGVVGKAIGVSAIMKRGAALGLPLRIPIRTGRVALGAGTHRALPVRRAVLIRAETATTVTPASPRPVPAKREPVAKQPPGVAVVPIQPVKRPRAVMTTGRTMDCLWLTGQRGAWAACGETSEPGRPYCWDHCKKAYENFGKAAA